MKLPSVTLDRSANHPRVARFAVAALAVGALSATAVMSMAGATSTTIESASVPHFAGALVNHSSHSLYILSSEKGAALKCTGSCLTSWPPLEVSTPVASISLGAGVAGKIGFVARGGSKKQSDLQLLPVVYLRRR
jgi:predicted lipoprotein with Yx(FWY)xxD motif